MRPWPITLKASGRFEMTCPPVTTKASERAIISMPSVTMKDGIRPLVVMTPFTKPIAGPISSDRITAGTTPICCINAAETAAASATTEPTEMSNSPEIMTMVMPAATIRLTAIWPIRLAMLIQVRKRGERIDMMTTRTASTASACNRP